MSDSGFGVAAGGGLDIVFSWAALRAIQLDYTRYAGGPTSFNNLRIGGGVVFRIGHKAR